MWFISLKTVNILTLMYRKLRQRVSFWPVRLKKPPNLWTIWPTPFTHYNKENWAHPQERQSHNRYSSTHWILFIQFRHGLAINTGLPGSSTRTNIACWTFTSSPSWFWLQCWTSLQAFTFRDKKYESCWANRRWLYPGSCSSFLELCKW